MDKEDRDYLLINFSVTTASSEHSNYLYYSSVESIKRKYKEIQYIKMQVSLLKFYPPEVLCSVQSVQRVVEGRYL